MSAEDSADDLIKDIAGILYQRHGIKDEVTTRVLALYILRRENALLKSLQLHETINGTELK